MNWDRATAAIGTIVQRWTLEAGPGGAVVLFDHRDIRAQGAGGFADLAHGVAFRPDTVLRFASVSKHLLTSTLLTGTPIGFSDTLGQHLILPEAAGAVTVGRALDMTGGLPDLVETLALLGIPSSTAMSRHRLMDACQMLLGRLNFMPGREISYSNTGYRLVQAALAAKGVHYPALLRERFFRPLGLSICLPEDETEPVPGLATGYVRTPSGWRAGRYGMHISASGGLAGHALDLATWGQALIGDRVPAAGLLARLAAPRHLADGRATQYGLGLARSMLGGRTLYGHGGSLPGYRSHLLLDPEERVGVVVLSNRDETDAGGLAQQVMAALYDVTVPGVAETLLPDGLFVTRDGPFWLSHRAGKVTYLGATETMADIGGGWAANGSAPLPMRLTAQGGDIIGEIGHVPRQFHAVPSHALPDPSWAGRYVLRLPQAQIGLEVRVSHGFARMYLPPLGAPVDLRPLDASRALIPAAQPICAWFQPGAVTLVTQRSRTMRFSAE